MSQIANYAVPLLAIATFALWLLDRPGAQRKWKLASASALAAAAAALVANQLIAQVWHRARPFAAHPSAHVWGARSHDPSFPSDHASAAFAIAFAVLLFDRLAGAMFAAAAIVVGFGRIVIGAHYPADVLAGVLVGLAAALLLAKLGRKFIELTAGWVVRLTGPVVARLWDRPNRGSGHAVKAAAQKVAFDNGGAFIRETRREVEQYLARGSTRRKGSLLLYAKAPVAIGLTAASWAVLVLARPGLIAGFLCLAGLVLGAMLTAFCVQHDANHGAYFRRRRYNHLVGWTADALLGFSSYAWRVKHNVAHHTYTNVDGYDDDATQVPLARFTPSQAPKPWYRFQHYYIWPMYTLMGLRWQTVGDIAAFARGSVGESALRAPRGWNLAGVIVGKAIFVTWAIAIPLLVYPWWALLGAYIGFTMVTSLIMATTFQLAHCVEEASFASAEEVRAARPTWAVHEVETTVDFCPRNPVLTWMLGGLNFQIEHHLFPRVPHTHYPQIARIVRRNCARHGVRYSSQPSLRAALRSHFLHLRAMGRLGLPAEIEMG